MPWHPCCCGPIRCGCTTPFPTTMYLTVVQTSGFDLCGLNGRVVQIDYHSADGYHWGEFTHLGHTWRAYLSAGCGPALQTWDDAGVYALSFLSGGSQVIDCVHQTVTIPVSFAGTGNCVAGNYNLVVAP